MRESGAGRSEGSSSPRSVVDRLAETTVLAGRVAADRNQLIDRLREITAAESGASWATPGDLPRVRHDPGGVLSWTSPTGRISRRSRRHIRRRGSMRA